MLLNQLGPSEFSGSVISASRCRGYWHSQPLGVLIGILGTNSCPHVCKSKCSNPLSEFFSYHACVLEFQWEHRDTGLPCIRQSFGCSSCISCLIGTLAELPGFLPS